MLEGLRRLRERGCATALVPTSTVNAPALRLYTSVGFHISEVSYAYVKAVR